MKLKYIRYTQKNEAIMSTNDPGDRAEDEANQPFVPASDRPEIRLTPETPLSDMRVRDLAAILSFVASKSLAIDGGDPLKNFFDKSDQEVVKEPEKPFDFPGGGKTPKQEKIEKYEKHEKLEVDKLYKHEKVEAETVAGTDSRTQTDRSLAQVIETITGLTEQVRRLTSQVEELDGRMSDDR